ncbi:MAG: GNAT family N-acetyltransferase [Cryobacterium sp.]|nr:GNAT family N-acetyltransferase [Cryobacterium sp.]
MPSIRVATAADLNEPEVRELYNSVGWSAYTKEPSRLWRALENSTCVVVARDTVGDLVGLARAISDDATICYVQDLLVHPDFQRRGVGRGLLQKLLARFDDLRQVVLITDDDPEQRKFYEALGLIEGADFTPTPLRMFARIR